MVGSVAIEAGKNEAVEAAAATSKAASPSQVSQADFWRAAFLPGRADRPSVQACSAALPIWAAPPQRSALRRSPLGTTASSAARCTRSVHPWRQEHRVAVERLYRA